MQAAVARPTLTGWCDVDLDERLIRVRQNLQRIKCHLVIGKPKTEQSGRSIILPLGAMSALRKYCSRQLAERMRLGPEWQDTRFVFTTQWNTRVDPRNAKRAFDIKLDNAELPHMRPETRLATLLLSECADLKTSSSRGIRAFA